MAEPKKKRNRDPLAVNAHENRCLAESQEKKVYLEGSRARTVPTEHQIRQKFKQCQEASHSSWFPFETPEKTVIPPTITPDLSKTPEYYRIRCTSIYHMFLVFGMPKEDTWESTELVETIMALLVIPLRWRVAWTPTVSQISWLV